MNIAPESLPQWRQLKPERNDGSLPVLEVDYLRMPVIAAGIWHAQMAGWERILTYERIEQRQQRKAQRRNKRSQIGRDGFMRAGLTADEYPFACTMENQGDVFLTNAPRHEQSIQGGELAAFLKRSGALTQEEGYFFFEVRVLNYPLA